MTHRRTCALLAIAATLVGSFTLVPAGAEPAMAPLVGTQRTHQVADTFTVMLKADTDGATRSTVSSVERASRAGAIEITQLSAVGGFTARLDRAALRQVRQDPNVAYVSPVTTWSLERQAAEASSSSLSRNGFGSWGQDRIDQRTAALDKAYNPVGTGEGVTAYVIDTGIDAKHQEFAGRLKPGFSSVKDNNGTQDCDVAGHGTHVAGTVGGATFGVAQKVSLVPVRVFHCNGATTDAIVNQGMDWIVANAVAPAVVNISFGTINEPDPAFNDLVRKAIAKGIIVVTAAGNDSADACRFTAAKVKEAIAVAASTSKDAQAGFSNWGECVDLMAPGSGIISAKWNTTNGSQSMNGTSMAAPHATGAAALYLSKNPTATQAQVEQALIDNSTKDQVAKPVKGTPNRILFVGDPSTPQPPAVKP